jgi:hypothetical protein
MKFMLSFVLAFAVASVFLVPFQVAARSFPEWSFEIGGLAGVFVMVMLELMRRKGEQPYGFHVILVDTEKQMPFKGWAVFSCAARAEGLSITEVRYYGYRWGAHVGPWLVFFGQAEGRE